MGTRVCTDFKWYRKDGKTIPITKDTKVPKGCKVHEGYAMDTYLKRAIDSMVHNVYQDMDFVIIITGGGNVRVGKSLLAIQIAYYMSKQLGTPFDLDHIVFTGKNLMSIAQEAKKPEHSVFIYDEAREAMNSKMAMAVVQRNLQQFFAECGQLNDIFILVLPDFFELTKGMAVTRSECLIDCYMKKKKTKDKFKNEVVEMQRGNFRYFKRKGKRMLYLKGKEELDYYRWNPDFVGQWHHVYPIDEEGYRAKKLKALKDTSNEENKVKKEKKNLGDFEYIKLGIEIGMSLKDISLRRGKTKTWAGKVLEDYGLTLELVKKGMVNTSEEFKMPDKHRGRT